MAQFIALIIIVILTKLVIDFIKEQFLQKGSKNNSGDVIDISDAWVDTSQLPYQKKDSVLNPSEISFYQLLEETLSGQDYIICPHIQMSELISVGESAYRHEYWQRLKERTLDIAILEAGSFKPVLVINLEEAETKKKQQLSNNFTTKALQVADIPILNMNPRQLPEQQQFLINLRKMGLKL